MEEKDASNKVTVAAQDLRDGNGNPYTRKGLRELLSRTFVEGKEGLKGVHFPDGRVPDFGDFLRMVAPNLSEEEIQQMVVMAERMQDHPVVTARREEAQRLYERVKAMGLGDGRVVMVCTSPIGRWEDEILGMWDGRKPADVELNIAPRMVDGQVTSYNVVKGRQGHPDAVKVEVDSLPAWLRNVDLPLDPIDRDVQSQYLNEIDVLSTSPKLRESLDRLNGGVRTMTLDVPEPSFGATGGCRSLMGIFGQARQRVSGDITVNGKQRKELVTNAKGTMVFPRAKQKFGRR